MSLRLATPDDHELVYKFGHKFISSTPYKNLFDEIVLFNYLKDFLEQSKETHVALLYGEEGVLLGYKTPFTFGNVYLATEVGWWVEPEARKKGVGQELKKAFEYWAQKVGCSGVVMVSLDDAISSLYQKDEYQLCERLHMKLFNEELK